MKHIGTGCRVPGTEGHGQWYPFSFPSSVHLPSIIAHTVSVPKHRYPFRHASSVRLRLPLLCVGTPLSHCASSVPFAIVLYRLFFFGVCPFHCALPMCILHMKPLFLHVDMELASVCLPLDLIGTLSTVVRRYIHFPLCVLRPYRYPLHCASSVHLPVFCLRTSAPYIALLCRPTFHAV